MINIIIHDAELKQVLQNLRQRCGNMAPVLKALGEDMADDAKNSIARSRTPDNQAYRPNAQSTLLNYAAARGGFSKKSGKLTKRGAALVMGKKPLFGESGDLRRQIAYHVAAEVLTVRAGSIYAAIQQFGGTKAQFPHLWGNIPARPFLPVQKNGQLYAAAQAKIIASLQAYF